MPTLIKNFRAHWNLRMSKSTVLCYPISHLDFKSNLFCWMNFGRLLNSSWNKMSESYLLSNFSRQKQWQSGYASLIRILSFVCSHATLSVAALLNLLAVLYETPLAQIPNHNKHSNIRTDTKWCIVSFCGHLHYVNTISNIHQESRKNRMNFKILYCILHLNQCSIIQTWHPRQP
jgi:hypothetical protein